MKRITYIIAASLLFFVACKGKDSQSISPDMVDVPKTASPDGKVSDMPVMAFEKDVHDFGRLTAGEKVSYSFKFTNTGKADLVITNVSASCGCTVASFPKGIIKPQATEYITVTFDSSGKSGQQNMVVTVNSNAQPALSYLTIRAQILDI